jgi:hypothetical protein
MPAARCEARPPAFETGAVGGDAECDHWRCVGTESFGIESFGIEGGGGAQRAADQGDNFSLRSADPSFRPNCRRIRTPREGVRSGEPAGADAFANELQ